VKSLKSATRMRRPMACEAIIITGTTSYRYYRSPRSVGVTNSERGEAFGLKKRSRRKRWQDWVAAIRAIAAIPNDAEVGGEYVSHGFT